MRVRQGAYRVLLQLPPGHKRRMLTLTVVAVGVARSSSGRSRTLELGPESHVEVGPDQPRLV